jgi:ATP-dependent Lhr-like helicase
VFVADPLVSVRQGRTEIGQVPDVAITAAFDRDQGPPALLLAGRAWKINSIDWKRRIAHVEATEARASVQFAGGSQPLCYEICQAMAEVLDGASIDPVILTKRAAASLAELGGDIPLGRPGRTVLVDAGAGAGQRWYTFAGLRANLELAARLKTLRSQVGQKNNLYITVDAGVTPDQIRAAVSQPTPIDELTRLVEAVSGALKLQRVLPESLVQEILIRRLRDRPAVAAVVTAPIDTAER